MHKGLISSLFIQDDVAGCFEYNADLAEALDSKQKSHISLPMDTFKAYLLMEPIGVVGLITPWYCYLFCLFVLLMSNFAISFFLDSIPI